MRIAALSVFVCALLGACGGNGGTGDAGSSMDSGRADGGTIGTDAGPSPNDAGRRDAGPPVDAGPLMGCAADGIQCDGDWEGECAGGCATDECCVPRIGDLWTDPRNPRDRARYPSPFVCAPREADGRCPAADIWVDPDRIEGHTHVEWRNFPAGDCSLVEHCVDAPGWRRILLFDTWTPNTGGADLFIGNPTADPTHFEYSACHRHYHFNSYAQYDLLNSDGSVAAMGHKQAFCLEDFVHYPFAGTANDRTDPDFYYDCGYQAIERNWEDVYGSYLDCQWIDVTDVAPGDYTLRVSLNTMHILNESDYSNNVTSVPVTIPSTDVTAACGAGDDGDTRECGWTREGMHTCTAGAMVQVGCSAQCTLGSCTGDPIMRVCDVDHDPDCSLRDALASNDDAMGCGGARCAAAGGGGCCPRVAFTCPASGSYVVFTAPYHPTGTATCTVATMP